MTRTSLLKKRDVAAKDLEIINDAGSTEKDQRNMVNSLLPEGYYGYRPELINNKHRKYYSNRI